MKSNTYATIDAHIIQCRLHHKNNLSYSVGLKSGTSLTIQAKISPSTPPSNHPKISSSIWILISLCMSISIRIKISPKYPFLQIAYIGRQCYDLKQGQKNSRHHFCQFQEIRTPDLSGVLVLLQG